ncbi:MAG: PKD domain-containing protein, partial [Bacteroidota bacterium]
GRLYQQRWRGLAGRAGGGDPASGASNTSSVQNPSHYFAAAGNYTVSLVATNDKGCSNISFTRQVSINPKPLAGYIIPDVCLSDTYAQFTDTSRVTAPDIFSAWQWNFGDPSGGPANSSILQNPQHSYSAVGSYTVELIVTTNRGCKDTVVQALFVNGSFPVANFSVNNPASLCANDSVAIVEASTVFPGSITKVEIYWDNGAQPAIFDTDDLPVTGKVYKHRYPNFQTPLTKTFTIRYRAYSGGVCVNDKFQTITVNAAPKVQFNAMADVCLDAVPFQITQASETGGVPGSAFYSGPGVSATGIFNPAVAGTGIHTIKYRFISSTGGCADSITQIIKVLAPPIADFSVSSPLCETKTITFTQLSTTPVGVLTNWSWDFGDGSAILNTNANPVTHTYVVWGPYDVRLNVTTSLGCKSTDKIIRINVNPQPVPGFSVPVSVCLPGANALFTNLSSIADGTQASLTYSWNFGDPGSGSVNNSTVINPSHTYNTTGPYSINLQVTSGAGCVKDTSIVLNTIHDQPLASFTINKPEECIGNSLLFTDNTNPMGGITNQWNWSLGDANTRTVSSFSYVYTTAGTYTVSLYTVNSFGCRSTIYSAPVTIHPYPVVDAGPDRLVLEGGQIILQPTVTGNDLTYLWTPNRYFAGSNTIVNPTVLGVDDITYTLTVTGRGGCVAADQVFIKVLRAPSIPNIFSPNGDGVHDTWVIQYLETYPGSTVDIFNRYGQRIYHSEEYSIPWDGTVNGKPVPVGTFYYIVNPKNGRKIMSGYVDVIR